MGRALLIVLDGFGIGKDSPFNAIHNSHMPFYRSLISKYPHAQLLTHGPAVGLPKGVMGNSEVGHMTIGSGRVIYQDLVRINQAIEDGSFKKNAAIKSCFEAGAKNGASVHLIGLISDGGVHSHIDHLLALLDLALELKIPRVNLHLITDGRDTPPDSAPHYIEKLLRHPGFSSNTTQIKIATLVGRYFAMDRDKRKDRTEKACQVFSGKTIASTVSALDAVRKSYENKITDEFFEPICFDLELAMKNGDSVFAFNFRSDRMRQLMTAFHSGAFFKPSQISTMTQYDPNFTFSVAFAPQKKKHILGEWLETFKLKQFRIAETEKYAHVTFFFNGGREAPFIGEDRVLIPSAREVATYDLKPEMGAREITDELVKRLETKQYDFLLVNFANGDMVGHTGNYDATIQAMAVLDECLAKTIGAATQGGYHVLLTADHGNAEEMRDSQGRLHTQHTLNPVPIIWVPPNHERATSLHDGTLADIMPTLCEIMKIQAPQNLKTEKTNSEKGVSVGKSLIEC